MDTTIRNPFNGCQGRNVYLPARPRRTGNGRCFQEAQPRGAYAQSGDLRHRDRCRGRHDPVLARRRRGQSASLHGPDHGLALVHGAVRQLRRGHCGGARPGAGSLASPSPNRYRRQAPSGPSGPFQRPAHLRPGLKDRRPCSGRDGRHCARRRRDRRLPPSTRQR